MEREGKIKYDHVVKVKMVGDSAVGKSSIITRFCDDEFQEDTSPTIGVDYRSKIMDVNDSDVKVIIWDTAGQERFRTITNIYYRGTHGLCMVYDVTRPDSFANIKNVWLSEAREHLLSDEVVIMLIGNKIDKKEQRAVSYEEAEAFARENEMLYIETSARIRIGIQDAFEELVGKILDKPSIKTSSLTNEAKKLLKEREKNEQAQKAGCC